MKKGEFYEFEQAVMLGYLPFILKELGTARRRERFANAVRRQLAGKPQLKRRRALSRDETFMSLLMNTVAEVRSSLQTLEDVSMFLNSFPYRSKKITQERYVRYHVEHFYQEVYILQNRLEVFGKRIARACRSSSNAEKVEAVTSAFSKLVRAFASHIIERRGEHVHVERLDDLELGKFSAYEMLARHDERLQPLVRRVHARFRTETAKWVRQETKRIATGVDAYFTGLKLVLAPHGEIIMPGQAPSA